jgi:hypothetical protein
MLHFSHFFFLVLSLDQTLRKKIEKVNGENTVFFPRDNLICLAAGEGVDFLSCKMACLTCILRVMDDEAGGGKRCG